MHELSPLGGVLLFTAKLHRRDEKVQFDDPLVGMRFARSAREAYVFNDVLHVLRRFCC